MTRPVGSDDVGQVVEDALPAEDVEGPETLGGEALVSDAHLRRPTQVAKPNRDEAIQILEVLESPVAILEIREAPEIIERRQLPTEGVNETLRRDYLEVGPDNVGRREVGRWVHADSVSPARADIELGARGAVRRPEPLRDAVRF